MRMNGALRSYQTTPVTSSTNALLQSLWVRRKSSLPVVDHLQNVTPEFISLWRMKFWTNLKWSRAEMLMQSQSVKGQYLYLEDSQVNRGYVQLRSIISGRTNGPKLPQWRTRGITWVHALSTMNLFTHSVDSSVVPNRRSTIALKCTKSKRINGRCSQPEWRILFGHVVH